MISVIKRERDFNTLPETLQEAVRTTKDTILNVNGGKEALLESGKFTGWHRLFIPENTVDVVAAYTQSVLGRAGRTVHFVDDWFCHTDHGEVHCATNVLRKAPATDSPTHPERPPWWQAYPDLAAADTDYNPNDTVYNPSS